jgi:hypothetical protein
LDLVRVRGTGEHGRVVADRQQAPSAPIGASRPSRSRAAAPTRRRAASVQELAETATSSPEQVLELQRQAGNAAVSTLLVSRARRAEGGGPEARRDTAPRPRARRAVQRRVLVQRKLGLPTKKEAQKRAGKAGSHVGKGKTAWGRMLSLFDKFRAVGDQDLAGQHEILKTLQATMEEWVTSDKRTKKKKGDDKKEAFIGELRGAIKVLYYEAETKGKVVDPIAAKAQQHSGANRQRIQAALALAKLDDSKAAIDQLLVRLRAAPLTTNLRPDTLQFYSKAGDFKNAFQTMFKDKSPGGVLKPIPELNAVDTREAAERYLGYSPFTEEQRENRPHYCGVNVFNNPKGAATAYGRFFFVWKDAVKARATYTAFDTFKMIKEAPVKDVPRDEAIGTSANMEATLAFNHGVLVTLAKIQQAMQTTTQELANKMYREAQIHGGLAMDDAAELVVDIPQNPTDPLELGDKQYVDTFAAKYPAIPIRWKK